VVKYSVVGLGCKVSSVWANANILAGIGGSSITLLGIAEGIWNTDWEIHQLAVSVHIGFYLSYLLVVISPWTPKLQVATDDDGCNRLILDFQIVFS
jgi:hypothetical protein